MEGYSELVAARSMQGIMRGWDQDGKKYVLPIYSNPTLIWWRGDILQKLGITSVPETFDDVYALSEKYAATDNKFGIQLVTGKNWYDRWYDFISYYYASADGAPYIKDGQAAYDNAASLSVLTFMDTVFKNEWTGLDFESDDPLTTGLVVGGVRGSWSVAFFKRLYPEILAKIWVGPMLTQNKTTGKTYTFADTKGLVIFKHSKVKQEAFEFISWVFSNDEMSLLWLEKTGLPPARGDLTDNPIFKSFYQANPLAKKYADYVDVAMPPAFIESTIDVQKIMGFEMVEPIRFGTKSPKQALADAIRRTNELLRVSQ